ncbi:MAG: hypothetical protein RSA62_06830 [Oscillospiraceae bacterium]
MAEFSEKMLLMNSVVGKNVKVVIVGGFKVFVGKCIGFTQPLDNEPEVAAILVRAADTEALYDLEEDVIESIEVLD